MHPDDRPHNAESPVNTGDSREPSTGLEPVTPSLPWKSPVSAPVPQGSTLTPGQTDSAVSDGSKCPHGTGADNPDAPRTPPGSAPGLGRSPLRLPPMEPAEHPGTFVAVRDMAVAAARYARILPIEVIDQALAEAERADALGPILDPTLWSSGHRNLDQQVRLIRALREFRRTIDALEQEVRAA
jgi:hypothetical protein